MWLPPAGRKSSKQSTGWPVNRSRPVAPRRSKRKSSPPSTVRSRKPLKLIDTNVVIYANGSESRYKGACLKILREVAQGTVEATADAEVLQELLHFYRRRNRAPFGVTAVEQTLRIVGSVLS